MHNWVPFDQPLEQHPKYPYIMYYSRHFLIDPILGHYLFCHGFDTEEKMKKFLHPELENDLYNPFLLNDMKKAVIRIIKAIKNREKILIFGDYDVDGITATSILYLGLKKFKANVTFRLPLREEGYGLSGKAMKEVQEDTSLVITVDNGTSSHEAMEIAKNKGIDVIVTDHHEILGPYPNCYAFISPQRHDSTYPFKSLCGAGVALKVVQALYRCAKRDIDIEFYNYIELATLGTIADLMPIIDENRVICKFGLYKMNNNANPIFKKIFSKSRIIDIDSSTIGFTLGPIFNSCGRISNPNHAVDLLTSNTVVDSEINSVIDLNKKRKDMTKLQFSIAEKQIQQFQLYNDKVIVVFDDFHNGIIGIIAARIAEKYKKPAIVISATGTGSARSVNGSNFSIINVINNSSELLKKYGGHQAAAGLSIEPEEEKIQLFRHAIQLAAEDEVFNEPTLKYIRKLEIQQFSTELYEDIRYLEPYGINISKPQFYCHSHNNPLTSLFGKNKEHLKIHYHKKEAVAFFKGAVVNQLNNHVHCLYSTFNYERKNFLIHSLHVEK